MSSAEICFKASYFTNRKTLTCDIAKKKKQKKKKKKKKKKFGLIFHAFTYF